jgi:hypothetical protein
MPSSQIAPLAILATDVDLAGEHQRMLAALQASTSAPPSRLNQLAAGGVAKIWMMPSGGWTEGPAFPLETPFPRFDRFSDGRWLVVASRDAADCIWVGWFDEGIFGNDDWRVPGKEWPPSSNGVACLYRLPAGAFPLG